MKAYLLTTGTIFGAITVAHIARVFAEGPSLAKEPIFVALTFLAAGMSIWGFALLRR